MPRVATYQPNQIAPAQTTGARLRPADNNGGVGGAIAEGALQLGATLDRASHVQAQLNNDLDVAGAKELDNAFVPQAQEIRAGFMSQRGLNAGVARPGAELSLKRLRDEMLSKATTLGMKNRLADVLDQRIASINGEFATHTAAQLSAAWDTASQSRQGLAAEEAAATSDPLARSRYIDTGLTEIADRGMRNGLGEDWIKSEQFKFESGVHSSIVQNMIIADNIDGAVDYLTKHRDTISDGDETRLHAMLKDPLERRETNSYVDGLMGVGTTTPGNSFSYSDPLHGAGRQPVNGGQYNASRDYGSHHGVDIPAPLGSPVYATGPGTAHVSHSKLGGNIVTIDHGDGTVSKYMHLGKVEVKDGDRVTPDTTVGVVGMTGRSTGPHLHFEMRENGKPVDPERVIGQVRQSPQRHDLNALLGRIDSDPNLTPEQRDRAKREVERRVGQDEQLQARKENDAQRRALDAVADLGDGFTSITQIPADVRAELSPGDRLRFMNMAEANVKSTKAAADGPSYLALHLMSISDPETFKTTDLRLYQSTMTPGEFASLAADQAKLKASPKEPYTANVRSEIDGAINAYSKIDGLDLALGSKPTDDDRKRYLNVYTSMRTYLDRVTEGGKRKPSDDDLKHAYDYATMEVIARDAGWFGSDKRVRRFDLDPEKNQRVGVEVPKDVAARIVQSYRRNMHRVPSEAEIGKLYLQNKGRPGFWD